MSLTTRPEGTATRLVRIVGCSFLPAYPGNLHRLNDADEAASAGGEHLTVILVRNPNNAYDPNAIEVHAPCLGDTAMIGHLPADIAASLAPKMDAGQRIAAEIANVAIDPAHPDRPGCNIRLWAVTS